VSESCCIEASWGNRCGCQYEEIEKLKKILNQKDKEIKELIIHLEDLEYASRPFCSNNNLNSDYLDVRRIRAIKCLEKLKEGEK